MRSDFQPPDSEFALLERALKQSVRGEVRFDRGSRALYATDASNYRQVPIGVVLPRDREDVLTAIAICRQFSAPIVTRGGGTSLAGQACNAAVVLDTSKYFHRVLAIDPQRRLARVEPGTILDDLNRAAADRGLTFGPDPATHSSCTLGGMIGNDSCGVHSIMAAFDGEGPRTADNVHELEVATYDGEVLRLGKTSEDDLSRAVAQGGRRGAIYAALAALRDRYAPAIREKYPDIPRRVSGYNLPYLLAENGFHIARALVGSEGTCVTVLEATVALLPRPSARALTVAGFSDVSEAARRVPEVLAHRPIGLEGFDDRLVADTRAVGANAAGLALLPEGAGWLVAEFGGATPEEAVGRAQKLQAHVRSIGAVDARVVADPALQTEIWRVRESALGVTSHVPGKPILWEGWEDSAVPPDRLADYMRDLRTLLDRYGYDGAFYGHFGQGCLHTRLNFDLETQAGVDRFRAFLDEAADLVVSYGGSLSGEHGDGQARGELLPKMFGPDLIEAFRQFKRIWDPEGRMNPGKVVDAYAITDNLRLKTDHAVASVQTEFLYRQDPRGFPGALQRCVGVGKCRRLSGGGMCPSFMVTREEKHSTRGRAHLLFEMLRGETIRGGWRDPDVREALDLCLSCKACKADCPVSVDMAAYKAEFLSHYYEGRLRPRAAYAMGLVHRWVNLASLAPGVFNLFAQAPGISRVLKGLTGISSRRSLPRLAREPFHRGFRRCEPRAEAKPAPRVLLWPDTFNNFFHPEILRAAVAVLEAAGFSVALPRRRLCCGRPLYDFGMLGLARRLLGQTVESLKEEIRAGTPVVVLEPSCASVLRDELADLLPGDRDAEALTGQTFGLAEFLQGRAGEWHSGSISGAAILQVHCHQKALHGSSDDEAALSKLGLAVAQPNDSCCGMAGAFGYEADHAAVSLQIGERALAPAIRAAPESTLIVADGFSCREQIRQLTGRTPLHFAQVLHRAIGTSR